MNGGAYEVMAGNIAHYKGYDSYAYSSTVSMKIMPSDNYSDYYFDNIVDRSIDSKWTRFPKKAWSRANISSFVDTGVIEYCSFLSCGGDATFELKPIVSDGFLNYEEYGWANIHNDFPTTYNYVSQIQSRTWFIRGGAYNASDSKNYKVDAWSGLEDSSLDRYVGTGRNRYSFRTALLPN
jgi:hypothetical protein